MQINLKEFEKSEIKVAFGQRKVRNKRINSECQ